MTSPQQSPVQPYLPAPPPQKSYKVRNTVLGTIGGLALLLVGVAIGSTGNREGVTVTSSPAATDQAQSQPPATKTAATPAPAAPFQPQTLLKVTGDTEYTTQRFTVDGSGDWDVYWSFTNSDGSGESSFWVDAQDDINFNGPTRSVRAITVWPTSTTTPARTT